MKAVTTTLLILSLALSACQRNAEERVATVNGQAISQEAFDAYLKFKRLAVRDDKQRQQILNQYLQREALAAVIDQEGKLDAALTRAELNEFRKEMLISRYFDQYLRDTVSDDAVRNYYASHADQYQTRKVHVAHILFRTSRTMGKEARQAKLTAAQEAASQLRTGKSFAEVAAAFSEDTVSAKKGGDLGWLKEGAIDPNFSKTVFSMKAGEVSEPFETAFGYHIVKLIEGPLVVKQPFKAVSGDIRYQLRNEAKDAELKRLLSKVKIEEAGSQ